MGIQSFLEKKAKGSIWQFFIKEHCKYSLVTFLCFSLGVWPSSDSNDQCLTPFVKEKELKENEIGF